MIFIYVVGLEGSFGCGVIDVAIILTRIPLFIVMSLTLSSTAEIECRATGDS